MPAYYGYPAVGGGNPSVAEKLVVSNAYGGLFEISQNSDLTSWSDATTFGDTSANIIGTTLIKSDLTPDTTLELITVDDHGSLFHYIQTPPDPRWRPVTDIPDLGTRVQGVPSLAQRTRSRNGQPNGPFELVIPAAEGGVVHLTRDNSRLFPNPSDYTWSKPTRFGTNLSGITALALIESNYGTNGHLEVAAIAKGKLYWAWRDSSLQWKDFSPILTEYGDVVGNPALIQSGNGSEAGNFELVVPAAAGGLWYFSRDNNDTTQTPKWLKGVRFAEKEGIFKGVSWGLGIEIIAQRAGLLFKYGIDGFAFPPVAPKKREVLLIEEGSG